MRMVYLLLGSVLMVLFVVKAAAGKKYNGMVEGLEGADFPVKSLYVVGFSWNEWKPLSLRGKVKDRLMGYAKLLYDGKYAEYYANVVWAQVLSFAHLCLTVGFLLAAALNSGLILIIFLAVTVVFDYYFLNRMKDLLGTRADDCVNELPEIVSTMALLMNAGMLLRDAWRTIAESKEGTVYQLMRQSCSDMDNGMSEVDAIHKFGRLSNSQEVRKFTSALTQSLERGGAELNDFLARQSLEMWTLKKQLMLQKGEAASSKLLAPTAILFVGIIIAVLTGAVGMLI